jgi:hypothetical protein
MSKLEELVPPLELCKKIPAGEFADSMYVHLWISPGNKYVVAERSNVSSVNRVYPPCPIGMKYYYPAPILPELLLACPLGTVAGTEHHGDFWVRYGVGDKQILIESYNSAECALRLWLKVNGIKTK